MRPILFFAFIAIAAAQPAELRVDRVAIVIGKHVLTESEVAENLRITELINGEPLDISPAKRKEEADRLIDQELLRNEMRLTNFAMPSAAEAETVLRQFIGKRYPSQAGYQTALKTYDVTEDELKQQLAWQLALLRFTEQRFRPLETASAAQDNGSSQSADRASNKADSNAIDQQMDAFLKDARANTTIVLKPGAFQ
uniref:SurA domain n=1 Tax=Solibacter usitatus (strain Ellin6076) TaxID=234267 RepID=Q01ZK0_SOLUE